MIISSTATITILNIKNNTTKDIIVPVYIDKQLEFNVDMLLDIVEYYEDCITLQEYIDNYRR
jgi:hypothetical protein